MDLSQRPIKYAVERLINYFGTAEGSSIPPNQIGAFRVPFVSAVRITPVPSTIGTNAIIVAWLEPAVSSVNIDHYAISLYGLTDPSSIPTLITTLSPRHSPVKIEWRQTSSTLMLVRIQTVLGNGTPSELLSSPTATYNAI